MAESSITRKAMGDVLKQLLEQKPWKEITVGEICNECGMNRKSFYYHFKDKYDLVNRTFDDGFNQFCQRYRDSLGMFEIFCAYLEEDRDFYRKMLEEEGKNGFKDHLHGKVKEILSGAFPGIPEEEILFFTDALYSGIYRWLSSKNGESFVAFAHRMMSYLMPKK